MVSERNRKRFVTALALAIVGGSVGGQDAIDGGLVPTTSGSNPA
jgi:hypothetical protein